MKNSLLMEKLARLSSSFEKEGMEIVNVSVINDTAVITILDNNTGNCSQDVFEWEEGLKGWYLINE